jgi:UDP-galactopyranose mutase
MPRRILVVGIGFAGAVHARIPADAEMNVHLIDRRSHIGGNAYDYVD